MAPQGPGTIDVLLDEWDAYLRKVSKHTSDNSIEKMLYYRLGNLVGRGRDKAESSKRKVEKLLSRLGLPAIGY